MRAPCGEKPVCQSNPVERAEDRLVVTGQPQLQVHVEILAPIASIVPGDIRQRTPHPVAYKDQHFDEYEPDQPRGTDVAPRCAKMGIRMMLPAKITHTSV